MFKTPDLLIQYNILCIVQSGMVRLTRYLMSYDMLSNSQEFKHNQTH